MLPWLTTAILTVGCSVSEGLEGSNEDVCQYDTLDVLQWSKNQLQYDVA